MRNMSFALTTEQVSPVTQDERERLHDIIQRCHAVIDPEQDPQLSDDIDAVLLPCDNAGKCVPPSSSPKEPQ